jgi:hypothetical protein
VKACDACAAAKSQYDKRWRDASGRRRKDRLCSVAQSRAYSRLAAKYAQEYQAFYIEEKARLFSELEAMGLSITDGAS